MGGTPCPANASYVNKINSSSFGRINFRQCLHGALPAAISHCAGKPYPGAFNVFRTCAAISDAIGTIFNLPIVLTSLRKFPSKEATLPDRSQRIYPQSAPKFLAV
jgi:hypothetical protein